MKIKKRLKGGARWLRSRFTQNGAILLYHRVVEPVNDRFKLCVTPEHFEEHMEILAGSGGALSLTEFVANWRRGQLAAGSVAVTFDDGYIDNLKVALPILEKYGIPATVFVVTGGFGVPFWWDRLEAVFGSATELLKEVILRVGAGEEPMAFHLAGRSRGRILDEIYPIFRKLESPVREEALEQLADALGSPQVSRDFPRAMTEDELRELGAHPLITIGAHTVNHGQLSAMEAGEQRREIRGSKKRLEAVLGRPVTTFSYPFGLRGRDFTERTMEAAKDAGLECALAADLDVVTGRSDAFALPRLWVDNRCGRGFRRAIGRWVPLAAGPVDSAPLPVTT